MNQTLKKKKSKILDGKGEKFHEFSEDLRLCVTFDFYVIKFFIPGEFNNRKHSWRRSYPVLKRLLPSSGQKPKSASWKPCTSGNWARESYGWEKPSFRHRHYHLLVSVTDQCHKRLPRNLYVSRCVKMQRTRMP